MRFYTQHHGYYCGIDLHARTMYVCIMDHARAVLRKMGQTRKGGGKMTQNNGVSEAKVAYLRVS